MLWYIIAGAFAIGAASKLASLKPTADVIAVVFSWAAVSRTQSLLLAAAVLAFEIYAVCAIVIGARTSRLIAACAGVLGLFTLVLAFLLTTRDPPSCGCMAILRTGTSGVSDAVIGIVRNLAMLGTLAVLARQPRGAPVSIEPTSASSAARGFTLVELLAVIAVIAAIISILLPTLRTTRVVAKDTALLARLPQYTAAISAYCGDYRDMFPYAQTPQRPAVPAVINGVTLEHPYFQGLAIFWPNMLAPTYLALAPRELLFESDPSGERQAASNLQNGYPTSFVRSSVWMTCTTSASPAYWSADQANDQRELIPQTSATTRHPSSKGLLLDLRAGIFRGSPSRNNVFEYPFLLTAFADGSAGKLPFYEALEDDAVQRPYGAQQRRIMTTRDGLWGRDRR